MISIFSFYPNHFNNNGDQGNVEVLCAELSAAGSSWRFTQEPENADFVLLGDASRAAMRHYANDLSGLTDLVRERYARGLPTLIVGSSYEFFAETLGLSLKTIERKSEFVLGQYFGYRNSVLDLPVVTESGSFFATSLFGPFLAKNPEALKLTLQHLGVDANLNPQRLEWLKQIREVSGG